MLATLSDLATPWPNGSGIFFHTLRQANANPEDIDTDSCADLANRPDTAPRSATGIAVAASSMCDRDVEKEAGGVPVGQVNSNTSSHCETINANANDDPGLAPPSGACANDASANANGGSNIEVLPCGAVLVDGKLRKEDRGWRKMVRNFTPSWFSVSMGTGVVALLLHNLPYNAHGVWYISVVVFCLNIFLFLSFSAITLTRYILYPEIWGVMIKHPSQSLFLGCIPMALATIVNMMVLVCSPWGNAFIYFTWALWWLDVILSCACSLIIPFVVVHHHRNQLSHMTAALLLPVVPVVVASASGGLIADVLPNKSHAVTTLVTSYILWGLGEVFSFFIMTVYFLRLQIHDLPPREVIVSVFLPIGPLGQGGFAIQQLGKTAYKLLPATGAFNGSVIDTSTPNILQATAQYGGTVLYMAGVLGALFCWGAALGWLAFAIISIMTTKSFPFNMGWWGFVFPLGVLTTCTGMLATELSSTFFKVITMIFSGCVFCLWILVAVKTTIMVIHGDMFYAPCLRDLRPKEKQAGGDRTN
ncbi:Plasma membrane sulfite pump involved in sulfite metabolism [Sporothrix bragantina]|uniref:Plasma membrane sulfite pump involved in sulfite metabolism n=1 Tax=Sporothrix bragantina TaxID=671064 RepID=A0ABP0BC70_9PEZI